MTQASRDCVAFGLRLRSAIDIPGAMPDSAPGEPDIEIAFGAGDLGPEFAAEGPYRVGRHGFEFAMPGVARYRCLDGNRILIDPDPMAGEDDVAAMLIATALPALLWARGDVVLHAAAFTHRSVQGAVAVAGPSGAGKSTVLAQRIAARDGLVVADDSLCLRLRSDATQRVDASGLPGGYYAPLGDGPPRRFNRVPTAMQARETTLCHLFVLTPGLDAPVRLHGADAFRALLANRHRPRIARLMRREAAMLPVMAAICRSIAIHAVPLRTDNFLATMAGICDIPLD